jgi:hypothetical protein
LTPRDGSDHGSADGWGRTKGLHGKKNSVAFEEMDDSRVRRKEKEKERGGKESEWYGHAIEGSRTDGGKGEVKRRERRRVEAKAAIEVLLLYFSWFICPDCSLAW